ncbi:MAG: phosphotransferase [Planctomycetota bacterium]
MESHDIPGALAGLAERAAGELLGATPELTLLGHSQSLAFRAQHQGAHYLLRVHSPLTPPPDPEPFTCAGLLSECAWLEALDAETDLVVQRPIARAGAGPVIELEDANGDAVPCTLVTWLDGEILTERRTEAQAAALGKVLATLHVHAAGWTPPPGFSRPTYDRHWLHIALGRLAGLEAAGVASAEHFAILRDAAARLEAELPVAADGEVGLIHADLHETNYVVLGDSVRPIDFSRCGFGPWLYDVAECIAHLHSGVRSHFLDAYSERRPLAPDHVERIEAYLMLSTLECIGYHAPNPDERDYLERAIPLFADNHFRAYLAREPFLFTLG